MLGAGIQFIGFVGLNAMFAAVFFPGLPRPSSFVEAVLSAPDTQEWRYLAQLGGIGAATVWNFVMSMHLTWRAR